MNKNFQLDEAVESAVAHRKTLINNLINHMWKRMTIHVGVIMLNFI